MNGRLFGIKKSTLLKLFALVFFVMFVVFAFLAFYVFKIPDLWFYSFCLFLGLFQILKSKFFKYDSSFYLGTLLTGIGIAGFVFLFTKTVEFALFYILSAFILASVLTFVFCGQRFHLIIAYSINFVGLFGFLLTKNLITIPIFIAFVVPFLVLLIVELIFSIKRRN